MKNLLKQGTDRTLDLARTAASGAVGTVGMLRRLVGLRLHREGAAAGDASRQHKLPGASPGIDALPDIDRPPAPGTIRIECVDYGPERLETLEIEDLEEFLAKEPPEGTTVRWLNVTGLHPYVVNCLREKHEFHTLAAEDVLTIPQRPKLEPYDDHLFIVVRMLMLVEGALKHEQVSLFYFPGLVLTFQERAGDVWDPIRKRLGRTASRFRKFDASYLLYALLDALVDHAFPILEAYGDHLENLESVIMESPDARIQHQIHTVKRDLILLRRVIWPLREVLNSLSRDDADGGAMIAAEVRTYMRDIHDHTIQVIDIVETLREMTAGLHDLYMSAISNRMNETMKVLTIMASFFIPITFLAGVYGMNFENIPELKWTYAYPVFWLLCLGVSAGLAWYFYRKGWIGNRGDDRGPEDGS